jgi:signal transduction histidine kinase
LRVLAGEIAHEVRNPLGSIALNLELLKDEVEGVGSPAGERRREEISTILRRIEEEVRSLRATADGYLEFARHPLGQRSEVQLKEFLDALLRFLAPELERARVEASTEVAPELPPVSLDAMKFKQVMTNLVRNAIEAMPGGGRLAIRAGFDERWLRVEVSDTGAGIAPDAARRLFEPSFSTKLGGTGLGLLLAREGAQAHGGRLEFRTEVGKGTAFVVSIPRG